MNIKTERLVIRPFILSDKAQTYDIYKDEETNQYLLHDRWDESTVDEAFQKRLDNRDLAKDKALNLAVLLENIVVGDLFVWYTGMKDTVEIGFSFLKTARGHGYATEAVQGLMTALFTDYHVHRIQANLDARNTSSQQLCERLGMRQEAHFIQDYWSKGEWTDSYVFGMLASEYGG